MALDPVANFDGLTDFEQAARYHARQRRLSHLDMSGLSRTHRFIGASAVGVSAIDTGAVFPGSALTSPVTFRAKVKITNSVGPGDEPQGMIFEFGSSTRGCALWIAAAGVAFRAGGLSTEKVLAVWIPGGSLPAGLSLDIVATVIPGNGRAALFINGKHEGTGAASSGSLGGGWADTNGGSFASAINDSEPEGITFGSNVAPAGFSVVSPLSVYRGQKVRHFV